MGESAPPVGGILVVDKPPGMTSHDVVARVRRIAGTRRVGHAGTLDPAATGVLVLGLDWSTRLLTWLTGHDKVYEAVIRFGTATVTDDAEGEPIGGSDPSGLSDEAVRAAATRFVGDIDQVPSAVSAVKVGGVRSYARVRSGEQVELAARRVRIARFDVGPLRRGPEQPGEPAWAEADAVVEASAGTYVRALARDLGEVLGTGGHLRALRRTRSGPFGIDMAVELAALAQEGSVAGHLLAAPEALRSFMRTVTVGQGVASDVRHGRRPPAQGTGDPVIAVLDPSGALVAVADDSGYQLRPLVVVPA